jgi:hypothetical protein
MRSKTLSLTALLTASLFLVSCSLMDSADGLLNVFNVKFSEGSPAVDGQTIVYSGSVNWPTLVGLFSTNLHGILRDEKNHGLRGGSPGRGLKVPDPGLWAWARS